MVPWSKALAQIFLSQVPFSLELLYICSSEKINTLFAGWEVRIEKNGALGLECTDRGPYIQDLGHSFSLYGPPSR